MSWSGYYRSSIETERQVARCHFVKISYSVFSRYILLCGTSSGIAVREIQKGSQKKKKKNYVCWLEWEDVNRSAPLHKHVLERVAVILCVPGSRRVCGRANDDKTNKCSFVTFLDLFPEGAPRICRSAGLP